jgi:hypothetical protein
MFSRNFYADFSPEMFRPKLLLIKPAPGLRTPTGLKVPGSNPARV